ncbi:FAD-dependent oxidoreductase [Caulobacter sp. 17J80-11]|uniref:FAD-dependent oxidoreductase n=1 Tax=Caulobacter sp. 17J80-11 TaxID=2763502 RepID=UPI0016538BCD|nr:FAD-dependent oxidoreductase [Caulobacter sp. 17J80-11]MBC6980134.1 FAD-dependent oxidoreductase [Caulobacter sp. 17J80-11]
MNVEQERSRSLWMEVPAPRLGALHGDAHTDVLVIGAGIAGLSTAYELAREGRQVTVVDRGRFARGQSARTTAHLCAESDDFFSELIAKRGRAGARQYYESQAAAIDRIETICAEEGIDCDFARVDAFLVAASAGDRQKLAREVPAAREAGLTGAELLEPGALPWLSEAAIRFPNQARFHPTKYMAGLVEALRRRGARLCDETPMVDLANQDGHLRAHTQSGAVITARQMVVATNTPFHLKSPIHTKEAPYRTYALAAAVPKGGAPDVLLWDTQRPAYHYVRLQPGAKEDLLIVGGEDHHTGEADDGAERIRRLESWARARWPQMGPVLYAWSGQVYEPYDHVPYIGVSPHFHGAVYLVCGDSGEGMTTGVAASLILRDMMMGRHSDWAEVYAPARASARGLGGYIKEQVPMMKGVAEHLMPAVLNSVELIPPGEGAVVAVKNQKVAAYRDMEGALHVRSAVCTHMGCVVHWNGFEGCWDCPCHGSQFSVEGQVLNGPAVQALGDAKEARHELEVEGTLKREPGQRPAGTPPPL